MQRIGLIGSDNSHVERFTEILNLEEHPAYWPESGATVWAIWGDDEALTSEEARKGRIPVVASSPEEVADACDLVFATSRRPDVHLAHARPAIEARKPLFVDKPLAQTPDQCRELLALVEEAGITMTCFSTLRYGSAANAYRSGLAQAGPVKFATYMGPLHQEERVWRHHLLRHPRRGADAGIPRRRHSLGRGRREPGRRRPIEHIRRVYV